MLGESTAYPPLRSTASLRTDLWHRKAGHRGKKGWRSAWCTQALAIVKGNSLSTKGVAFFLKENVLCYLIFPFFQVIGSGVSSVFALCLGQTSSFCKAIVFASASVGLQTFNHR